MDSLLHVGGPYSASFYQSYLRHFSGVTPFFPRGVTRPYSAQNILLFDHVSQHIYSMSRAVNVEGYILPVLLQMKTEAADITAPSHNNIEIAA